MATIKVFDSKGVKELKCFDTLSNIDYLPDEVLSEPQSESVEED